jgi:MFS family permease
LVRHLLANALLTASIGIPGAFFTIVLPAMMRDGGASLFQVGLVYLVWAPSALKWLWARWFDALPRRPFGSTFGWMRALILAIALSFLATLPLVERLAVWPLVGLAVVSAAFSVTLQMLFAGWLMDDFDERTRALANGVGVAGMVTGGVIGGGLLPLLASQTGWTAAITGASAFVALTGLGTIGLRRLREKPHGAAASARQLVATLRLLVLLPGSGYVLAALAMLSLSSGADATIPARLIDAGYDPAGTGVLLGMVATLAIIPVSGLTGFLIRLCGKGVVLSCIAGAKAVVLGLLAWSGTAGAGTIATLSVLDFVLAGAMTVALWQVFMGHAAHAASPILGYSALTAVDAAVRLVAGVGAGALAMAVGYSGMFGIAALLACAACLISLRLPNSR